MSYKEEVGALLKSELDRLEPNHENIVDAIWKDGWQSGHKSGYNSGFKNGRSYMTLPPVIFTFFVGIVLSFLFGMWMRFIIVCGPKIVCEYLPIDELSIQSPFYIPTVPEFE